MQHVRPAPGARVLITWTDGDPYSAMVQSAASNQLLMTTPDGRNFLVPTSAIHRPVAATSSGPTVHTRSDPTWGTASGSVMNFMTRQNVNITGNQLEMILDGRLGNLTGATFVQGEHEGLWQQRAGKVVVHASVERGDLRVSVEVPTGEIASAEGHGGDPVMLVSDCAVSGKVVRVKFEALSPEVVNAVYMVRFLPR